MRRTIGLLLLLIQLGPVAGAGLCLHAASLRADHCATPMEGMQQESDRPHHGPSQDCALMVLCAPAGPVVPGGVVLAFSAVLPTPARFTNPPSLLQGDPIAPPQPPPIV